MKKAFITISAITFLIVFSCAKAQMQTSIDGVTISAEPTNPTPGQTVTVSIESYLIDLDSASIVWLLDGKSINKGIGIKKIEIKAPKAGKKSVVNVAIANGNGREIQKAIVIKSGAVEILWESKGYMPPFFKGKNSFIYQNTIKLIAVPHLSTDGVSEINPKNLIYKWKKGGKYIDNGTGYGIQSVDIKADDIPRPMEIEVEVYTKDQNENAIGYINLEPTEPSIDFYEIDPLYGIFFNKSIGNRITLNNSEITVLAVPYGFNKKISYSWSINNIEQTDLSENQSITLRTKGDVEGSSNINLEVKSLSDILQGASSGFTANFKKTVDNSEPITF
jgi:hypothetical protein